MTDDAEQRIDRRRNSLNALRLFLAAVVIVSHAPKAVGEEPLSPGGLEIGGWAVAGFFAISGWLVTDSRLRLRLVDYFWHRALRIYPGFWACLAVTAFVLAPLTAALGDGRWSPLPAIRYVVANATLYVTEPIIGSTLDGAPNPSNWNLSLWTLAIEFLCYVGIGLLLSWGVARRRAAVTVVAFVAASAAALAVDLGDLPVGGFVQQSLRLGAYFLAGALLLRWRSVPFSAPGAAVSVVALAALTVTGQMRVLGALPLAYLCLWLGRVLPLHRIGRRNDVSYGVYVYAYPVQLLLAVAGVAGWWQPAYIAVTLALVLPLAWASWLLVERPALRLKSRRPFLLPGRARLPVTDASRR